MARAIDADKLQELCNKRIQDTWNNGTAPVSWAQAYADFKDDIDSIPTLTPLNEPLTWEELKEMDGEPVYIVEPKKAISSWMLIDMVDEKSMWCVVGIGSCYRNFYKTYGKTWIAYRRPPEGEEEN